MLPSCPMVAGLVLVMSRPLPIKSYWVSSIKMNWPTLLKQQGYDIEPKAHGQFELKGYDPELLKAFSTQAKADSIFTGRVGV